MFALRPALAPLQLLCALVLGAHARRGPSGSCRPAGVLATIALALALGAPVPTVASTSTVDSAPLFAAPYLTVDTGLDPRGVAIGDLNGDCKPDLAVSSFLGNTVSVVLGDGRGGFGPKTDFATAAGPASLAIADFDGDGNPDLATANTSSSTVSVLLGNGHGTFSAHSDYATAVSPRSVAIGDLNGDGKPDLALATFASTRVSVLLGNGDGTFGLRSDYGSGGGSVSVAIRDLNADGKLDLAAANGSSSNSSSKVSVLLGNGDGTFGSNTDYGVGGGSSVAVGDVNGDGVPDVAVTKFDAVSVFLGNGDGTLGPNTNYTMGGSTNSLLTSVAIGDLNLDGKLDLATANLSLNLSLRVVSTLLGNGDGTFGAHSDYVVVGGLRAVSIGDLNGDGWPDLAVSNAVLLGDGEGTFGRSVSAFATGLGPSAMATSDLDGDGKLDLVTANRYDNTVSVLQGSGNGTFGAKADYGAGELPVAVAVGDLNGDGKPDLVTANASGAPYSRTSVSVLLGNGNGTFEPKIDYSTYGIAYSVAIGDLDGDGKPDLAVANRNSSWVSVLHGNGDGTFGSRTEHGTGSGPSCVAIGDLNGDGKQDLATANRGSLTLSVLLGNGDGTFGPSTDYASTANVLTIGDLNGDGRPDLVTANDFSRPVSVLLGNGDGTFGPNTDYGTSTPGATPFVAIADLNGDGQPDLAWLSGTVAVLLGNGDGTFGARSEYGTGGSRPSSGAIADFNGDGKPDIAVTDESSNMISVLLNIGGSPIPPLPMALTLPGTLNLRSLGHWVTAYLQPGCLPASTIDVSSIRFHGNVAGTQPVPVDPAAPTAIADQNGDGAPDLMVMFDRAAVELTLTGGAAVPVTVAGTVAGEPFSGVTTLKVLRAHVTSPTAGTVLNAGTAAAVTWETPPGVSITSVALLSSLDDGSTWTLEANDIPNGGFYGWTVPGAESEHARVAVVLVESADAPGHVVSGVLGVSDAFRIVRTVGVGQGVRPEFALRRVRPNPALGALNLDFSLTDARPARVEAMDVLGRLVMVREVGRLGPGRHHVELGGLRAGVYLIRLIQGAQMRVERAVVLN